MMKQLFEQQKTELDFFFQTIDLAAAEKIFEKILSCSGVVIFSGVGKSGHIGKKLSATFVSTGTRSTFLSPAHALHGDLGFVSSNDVFIALSKSGESQELLDLIPHL